MSSEHRRKRNSLKQMRLASIGALSITLTILGLIALVKIVATNLSRSVKEQVYFSVELPQSFTEDSYQALASNIYTISGIKRMSYISADSAMAQIAPELGEDPRALLGYNPLFPVIRMEIDAAHLNADSLKVIEQKLENVGLSAELQYDEDQLKTLNKNVSSVEWILWGFVILQGLFTFVQINNTIRMMIHSDRLQIRTLTLVGASSWFIRRPIVFRSVGDGIIATLVSLCFVIAVVYALEYFMGVAILPLIDLKSVLIASALLFLIAVVSSALAAIGATGRYINMDGRKIFLI